MFGEIINPFLNVRNKIKNTRGAWVDKKIPLERQYMSSTSNVDLGSNGRIFFDTNKKIIIDSFQLSSNSASFVRPRLHSNREFDYSGGTGEFNNNIFMTTGITSDRNSTMFDATFTYINSYGHPLLESVYHNGTVGRYKMINKAPIILPEGGKLGIYGSESYNPSQHTWACIVVYREIEVL